MAIAGEIGEIEQYRISNINNREDRREQEGNSIIGKLGNGKVTSL